VYIATLAEDELFVSFRFARVFLASVLVFQHEPDAMVEQPSCFLCDFKRSVNLMAGHAILAVHHHPHSHRSKPMDESSVTFPFFNVKCGEGYFPRKCQRL
jgi:hypothetical protein